METFGTYSRGFLLQVRTLELCQKPSPILKTIDMSVIVTKQPPPFIPSENRPNNNNRRNGGGGRRNNHNVDRQPTWRVPKEELKRGDNAWVPDFEDPKKPKTDIKKIRGILNRLSEKNKEVLLAETQAIEYTDPEVVTLIFQRAVTEPFFAEMYARFCLGLTKLHSLIRGLCAQEFSRLRNKNLCRFIGELYKLKLIDDLNSFIDFLKGTEDLLDEKNLEILCELIVTVNPRDPQFETIINELYNTKTDYSVRFKFMIMDVYDFKTGKRKPKQQRAKLKQKSSKVLKEYEKNLM